MSTIKFRGISHFFSKPPLPLIFRSSTEASDKQAFDTLYKALQDIGDITQRAIRDGERGHRPALHEIMKICRGVE